MSYSAIEKIKTILAALSRQASDIDAKNSRSKSHYLLKDKSLFSELLFSTYSDKFLPYVQEVEKRTLELERMIKANKADFAHSLAEKIERQISALVNGLNSNQSMHDEAAMRSKALKSIKAKKYKKAIANLAQPTQELYQKLSEHHEFERRLLEMVQVREQERTSSTLAKARVLSQEILALHQRLGRCRQAIVKIERQIEFAEKRH